MHFSTLAVLVAALVPATVALATKVHQEPLQLIGKKHQKHQLNLDLIGLHGNLTSIESISGNELEVGEWLASYLEDQGYTVKKQKVAKDRYNVHAWPGNVRDARTLITSHIDTVPPFYPYKIDKNDTSTYISGRGSVDAKASVAAQIIAVNSLLTKGKLDADDVALLFVVGEEVGGDGMRFANDLSLSPKTIIFGEPTEGKLAAGHKGNLGFYLHAIGHAAHSGYPWLGRSANDVLIKALAALMDLGHNLPTSDKYGATTINIGKIEGGVAGNVVAESASALIAMRIAAGTPDEIKGRVLEAINAAVLEYQDAADEEVIRIEFLSAGYGPVDIDTDVPGFDTITVNYGTDIPNFDATVDGQKRYLYGPGSILVAHSDHEGILLTDLEKAVGDYEKLILHSLSSEYSKKDDL